MALCKESVKTAHQLLLKIGATNKQINEWDKGDPIPLNKAMGYYFHGDGWENVFMDVQDITPEQREMFDHGRHEVPNTSFIDDVGNGITRLGWF